jgi:preprotein translocase subunit SecD
MFGSFMENFGLNAFPWDSLDPQGGLFGQNAPQTPLIGSQPSGTAPPQPGGPGPAPPGGGNNVQPVAAPQAPPAPNAPATPQPSPLGSPFAQGGTPAPAPAAPAPAAGVGSAFGSPLS